MGRRLFIGSTELTADDLKQESIVMLKKNGTYLLLRIAAFLSAYSAIMGLLILIVNTNLIAVIIGIAGFVCSFFPMKRVFKSKREAPMNQCRHPYIALYERGLHYHDEYVTLDAYYDQVKHLYVSHSVIVFVFNKADSVTVPIRCFNEVFIKEVKAFINSSLIGKIKPVYNMSAWDNSTNRGALYDRK